MKPEEFQHIARWWFCQNDRHKRRAMLAASEVGGSIEDLVQEVFIRFCRFIPRSDVKISTAICNQCLWVSGRLIQKAMRRREATRRYPYTQDHYPGGDDQRFARQQEISAALQEALRFLSDRERRILCLRYGLTGDREHTLGEASEIFGVTRERIRQIESRALRKLAKNHALLRHV